MEALDQLRAELAEEIDRTFPALDADERANLAEVCSLSEFFTRIMRRSPDTVRDLFSSGDIRRRYVDEPFALPLLSPASASIDELDTMLRQVRNREMIRVIYRDLLRHADLLETTRDLSNLADAVIEAALDFHYRRQQDRYGTPIGAESGEPVTMAVLALGKLGARELNLSSDIDLVFFFGEAGEVDGEKELSNSEFFVRLSRAIISSLDKVTEDGFVFRVDMRLRPYGDSGGLILAQPAMEKYYIEQGRDWERYAFIKARACAGDIDLGEAFLGWLVPFVYRRHLDFGAIDSLREMKRLINYEVDVKGLADDLKLGHGGIREIEFIAQAYQLVYGGTEPRLRERSLLRVLSLLREEVLMPEDHAETFESAYWFLRNSEHAIQAEADRQTQQLPAGTLSQARLARAMGYDSYDDYREALDRHRERVRQQFSDFMSGNRVEQDAYVEQHRQWQSVWQSPTSPESIDCLEKAGYADAGASAEQLVTFAGDLRDSDVQEIGVERVERLMPAVLSLVAGEQDPGETLNRMLRIIDAIVRRSTYVSFLLENLDALKRTVELCARSPWIAERLESLPILLYELTDRVHEEQVFDRGRLSEEMRQLVQNLDPADLEAQMDSLRQFKNSAVIKVAVFEILGLLPTMRASDALTDIAEIAIGRAFELAWGYLVERHGAPCDESGKELDRAFAVIAYGKLGGIELGYGSDLDLVFLHDADPNGATDGQRSIDNATFYIRLGQRMVHVLTSMTRFGVLYEIDLRLRPQGNSGPIVTSVSAYERYLLDTAWTWEHQALVRARFVAGTEPLKPRFEAIRRRVLQQHRDREALLKDVVGMREKMRRHLDKPEPHGEDPVSNGVLLSGFDLKQGAGAIVDIEFMVQYAVLAESGDNHELTQWTDKMRILSDLRDAGLFTPEEVSLLQRAYIAYRTAVHFRALGCPVPSMEELGELRTHVVDVWNRHMTTASS